MLFRSVGITPANITGKGPIGLVSKSGTLTYQMMFELRDLGFSTAIGIGGDPIIGTTHIDALAAFEADPPTIVLHLQDFGGALRQSVPASGRMIESYTIGADLHRSLGEGTLRRRTWYGRQTAVARTLADHPDARIGDLAAAACKRSGFSLRDGPASTRRGDAPGTIRLGPGRYLPTLTYRRLGASSLAEIALARFGAHGITVQVFDGTTSARIGTALSIAEGALLARLGLETS